MWSLFLGFLVIFLISLVSLIGLFMISLKEKTLDRILFILVAFATGTIFATALFDLIPESLHHAEELNAGGMVIQESLVFIYIILGFVIFFILERFIYWFHGHAHEQENQMVCYESITERKANPLTKDPNIKTFVYLNLIGDGMHNFLDGVVILVSFLQGINSGIVITLAVFFHELPQEIGDFGILVYGGFTKKKALIYNFLSGIVAILGGVVTLFLTSLLETFNLFILAFSGGGFLYLACVELMPELIEEKNLKKSLTQAFIFIAGIILIISLIILLPHE
ncbi:MAG: ZIP family metal transporter [Candidatus Thorarchaeota archaeon]